jgi:hypothetical protein
MKYKHGYIYCDCGGSYPPEAGDQCPFCGVRADHHHGELVQTVDGSIWARDLPAEDAEDV